MAAEQKQEEEEPFIELKERSEAPLPANALPESSQVEQVDPRLIIPIWIALSAATVLFNKHVFTALHFPFPIFLTGFHMLFATVGTNVLKYTTHLLDAVDEQPMTFSVWSKAIPPLAVMFSASLILSNLAVMHLSVSFVQMLKGLSPAAIMVVQVICGFAKPAVTQAWAIAAICLGCMIASRGELAFSLFGFLCQLTAITFDAFRLVLVQTLLQTRKMDPLVAIYYYAPVGFMSIAILQPVLEGPALEAVKSLGVWTLCTNGAVAFLLNVASVYAIRSSGSLVISLAGVVKDIMLIGASTLFLGSQVTSLQIFGYSITIGALCVFKTAESGVQPGTWSEMLDRARAYQKHALATAVILAASLTVYFMGDTAISDGLTLISIHSHPLNVPTDPSVALSQATMNALGTQLFAAAHKAEHHLYVAADCRADCRAEILREVVDKRRSEHVIFLGPRTTLNPSALSIWRQIDYLSVGQPIGVLTGNDSLPVYPDYMAISMKGEHQISRVRRELGRWLKEGSKADQLVPLYKLDEKSFSHYAMLEGEYLPVTLLDRSEAQPQKIRDIVCKDCDRWLWSDVDLQDRRRLVKLAGQIKVKRWKTSGAEDSILEVAPLS